MSGAFRKVVQAFTPRPRKRKEPTPPPTPPPVSKPGPTFADVKTSVRNLVTIESSDDPRLDEARADVVKHARAGDMYLMASAIFSYVSSMKSSTDSKRKLNKSRAYGLAGELYFEYLRREIATMDKQDQPLGPSIFKTYCDELFDCYLDGTNFKRGLSYSLIIMEELIRKAVTNDTLREASLNLAEQVLASIVEVSGRRFEKDTTKAQRKSRLMKRGVSSGDDADNDMDAVTQELMAYFNGLQDQFAFAREEFLNVALPETSSNLQAMLQYRVGYLYKLLKVVNKAGFQGLTAWLKEVLGLQLQKGQPEQARGFFSSAALDYEVQADKERAWHLQDICLQRYKRARDLYRVAKNDEKASEIEVKLAAVARAAE